MNKVDMTILKAYVKTLLWHRGLLDMATARQIDNEDMRVIRPMLEVRREELRADAQKVAGEQRQLIQSQADSVQEVLDALDRDQGT